MIFHARRWPWATAILVCLLSLSGGMIRSVAQSGTGSIHGTVTDQSGQALQGATVTVATATTVVKTVVSGEAGKYTVDGLPAGTYVVEISASGFSTQIQHGVVVAPGATAAASATLSVASVSQEVTVEAEGDTSIAAKLSPVKSVLDAGSPRTEITSNYVSEFTSPVTDFADLTQAAPGTVSYDTNGVGLGQAKIYFRGFADADYTMTWDGVPFEDSNDPTHHSWAYVPAPAIGYVDFDRSPGTASDMGPSNFGGSIHFFSPQLPDTMSMRVSESYGSFNTNQIVGEFYSGLFLHGKGNFWFEGHHMSSDGYQTFNYQQRTAGTAKFTYKFSDTANLALVGTVVLADSNNPDSDPTRQQIADHGDNYVMDNTPTNPNGTPDSLYYRFYTYHIPTNFEIVTFTKDFSHGWRLETKPYTYSYSNHQHLQKKQDQDLLAATPLYEPVNSKSGINKMNQYNRGGQITTLSAASKYGVFRTGAWYEYTTTNRYQIESNPLTWVDVPGVKGTNFHERFITQTVQPFVEYQLIAIPRWTITAGLKDAYFNMWLKQYADNGKKVGGLNGAPYTTHDAGYNSWLPSVEANFRVRNNWSVYGDFGQGSVAPYSSVFDVQNAQVGVTPPPTIATTYQGGTVVKLNRVSFDADAYHIHFDNQYDNYTVSNVNDPNYGITYYYATPPSNTNGAEAEGNIAFGAGVSLFLNGTIDSAKYQAAAAQAATATAPATAASPSAWVALAPKDTESLGLMYQSRGWDLGFMNKRVGQRWDDDGAYHQNVPLDPFWMNNLFLNYTIRKGSFFDNSKVKLSVNNLFDNHNVVDVAPNNGVSGSLVQYTPDPLDQMQLLPGRSVMLTVQFGLSPKER